MSAFVKWMDDRNRLVKILFCLPIIDILWGLYRLFEAISIKDWFKLVLAIIWILIAGFVGWVLDLVWIIVFGHIFWFKG